MLYPFARAVIYNPIVPLAIRLFQCAYSKRHEVGCKQGTTNSNSHSLLNRNHILPSIYELHLFRSMAYFLERKHEFNHDYITNTFSKFFQAHGFHTARIWADSMLLSGTNVKNTVPQQFSIKHCTIYSHWQLTFTCSAHKSSMSSGATWKQVVSQFRGCVLLSSGRKGM